jgi:hypothetical protein
VGWWLCVPPAQDVDAQTYGPGVASSLTRFNVVASSSGNNVLIAAKANTRFRIVYLKATSQSTTAVNAYYLNGDNALMYTAASPQPYDMAGISGIIGEVIAGDGGWLETDAVNEAFQINLSGAQKVAVVGAYVEVRN